MDRPKYESKSPDRLRIWIIQHREHSLYIYSKYIFETTKPSYFFSIFSFLLFTMFTWGFAIQNVQRHCHSASISFLTRFFGWTRKSQLKYSNQHLHGKCSLIQWDSRSTGSKAKFHRFMFIDRMVATLKKLMLIKD